MRIAAIVAATLAILSPLSAVSPTAVGGREGPRPYDAEFSLSVSPEEIDLRPGEKGTVTVHVTPVGNFSRIVSVGLSGSIAATIGVSSSVVVQPPGDAEFTIDVGFNAVAPAREEVRFKGSGPNETAAFVYLFVNIIPRADRSVPILWVFGAGTAIAVAAAVSVLVAAAGRRRRRAPPS